MDRMRLDLKTRTAGTKGANNLRVKQAEKRAVARSNARSNAFAKGRKMDTSNTSDIGLIEDEESKQVSNAEKANNLVDARRIRLEKWKQDKLKKEAYIKSKQKPVFKTGVVHHSIGSPNIFGVPSCVIPTAPNKTLDTKKILQPRNGTTTRAMRANMKAQAPQPLKPVNVEAIAKDKQFKAPSGVKAVAMLTIPTTPKGMSERKKFQAKMHTNCRPPAQLSKAGRSLAFPAPPGQLKQNSVNNVLLLAKRSTPNVRQTAEVNIVKPTVTPNAGLPKKLISVCANPKTTPYVSKKVTALTPGLAPIADELPDTPQQTVVDPTVSSSLPVVLAKKESPILNFKHSPHVTVSRGKYSDRRKSVKSALADTSSSLIIPIGSLAMDDEGTTVVEDDSQHPAIRYRTILGEEINRLNGLCNEWTTLRSEYAAKLSEDVNSLVDLAVGQTQLLIRSKFEQFRGLTYDCEKGVCTPPVTAEDLQGFWEMVYIQVENVDKQFRHLTELKGNDFAEKSPTKAVTKKRNTKKPAKPAAKAAFKSSGIRALIEAQRNKQPQEVTKPVTPGRSSARSSLLRDVLSSSAVKQSQHLSPIIMKVSQMAKSIGSPRSAESTAGTSASAQTPYKGILKDVSMVDSTMKERRKTVNFGESTIKNMTPDFETLASPADEPPAYSALHVEDSRVEQQTDVGSCATPTGHSVSPPTERTTSLKRRTRWSYHKIEETKMQSGDVNKENYAAKSPLTNGIIKGRTRQQALLFDEESPVHHTPMSGRSRRSYRKTPYKKKDTKANKTTKVLAEQSSESATMDDIFGTPMSMDSWRLSRKSPYKEITNNSSDEQRVSLLPSMEELPSPIVTRLFSTGDLISFATPLRRSTRAARKH